MHNFNKKVTLGFIEKRERRESGETEKMGPNEPRPYSN